MGDLPFTICFDFETTTGDSVLLDKKMYVISYCQVYTFHPKLKLPKNIVLKSFQQNNNEITSLDHLSREHIPYFDQVTMSQMKDSAMRVLHKENTVALAELFALELKFPIYTLVKWFNFTIKTKFLELDNFQKQAFMEKNPLDLARTTCSICGFKLCLFAYEGHEQTLNLTIWFDFIVKQEYLFLKNIGVYNESETLESFYESFEYFLEMLALLKNENFKLQEMEQEKLREFLENCCADCEDGQEIHERINEFKIVKKKTNRWREIQRQDVLLNNWICL